MDTSKAQQAAVADMIEDFICGVDVLTYEILYLMQGENFRLTYLRMNTML
jgi:hypothetical protein